MFQIGDTVAFVTGGDEVQVQLEPEWDVFLAHSSVDKPTVRKLYELLADAGLRVCLDEKVLKLGDRWPSVFPKLMDRTRCFVATFSTASTDAEGYFQSEIVRALQLEKHGRRIIPILIEDGASVQYGLEAHHYAEAFDDASLAAVASQVVETLDGSSGATLSTPVRIGAINLPERRAPAKPGDDARLVGRSDKLVELHDLLTEGTNDVTVHALSGMGGIGKSALALEYCYLHKDEYPFVWWVDASSSSGVSAGYQALADYLGVSIHDGDDLQAVMDRHLRSYDGWLAVFDNVIDRDNWTEIRPDVDTGRTVITSRSPMRWDSGISVDLISEADAVDWLLSAAGHPDSVAEADAARGVAQQLDGLALALTMATAYISETGCSIASYHGILEEEKKDVLAREDLLAEGEPTVFATWNPSVQFLRDSGQDKAVELLETASFYAPKKIPLWIFHGDPFGATENEVNLAVRELMKFSLVERQGDFIDIHALVQDVTRYNLQTADA